MGFGQELTQTWVQDRCHLAVFHGLTVASLMRSLEDFKFSRRDVLFHQPNYKTPQARTVLVSSPPSPAEPGVPAALRGSIVYGAELKTARWRSPREATGTPGGLPRR